MNKEILKELIIRQTDIFLKDDNFIERFIFDKIKKDLALPHIIIISWLRRVGKSTLLKQINNSFLKKSKYTYINFEDEKLFDFKVSDFDKLFEVFIGLNENKKTYFFDEIQNIKSWELAIRRLYDEQYKFYITGSNASMLSKELGTKLTWRHIKIELFPFSFKEFLLFNNFSSNQNDLYLPEIRAKIFNYFEEYFNIWWIPEYIKYKNEAIIKQVYDDIIYKDILVRYKLTDEKSFKELSKYILSNITKEVSYNKIKNFLWFGSVNTVKSYMHYLENSYLIFQIEKFDHSLKKQLINPKKVYCIDVAFMNLISFFSSKNLGQKLENLVFLELKRREKEVFYHRNKKECDFITREWWIITEAIQVSYAINNPETKKREIDWLCEAMDTHNLKTWLILTYNEEEEELSIDSKKIQILPVWKWLL